MDREEIIRMAREACDQAPREDWNSTAWVFGDETLERFAALVAAHEREACARLCDQMFHDWCNQEFEDEDEAYRNRPDAEDCKKAIRERGEK
jgi:hypothetical protein